MDDGVFESKKSLAKKLKISHKSLNDLLSLTKIPIEIMDSIDNPNKLSKNMAIQITKMLSNSTPVLFENLKDIAPQIGKTITSPIKLLQAIESKNSSNHRHQKQTNKTTKAKQYKSTKGNKIFSFKYDRRGLPTIVFDQKVSERVNMDYICALLQKAIETGSDGDIPITENE